MERASRLIGQMKISADAVSAEQLACAAWKVAVGPRIAVHARAGRLVRTKLIVGVDDQVWQRQLFTMSRMILSKIEKSIGPGIVDDLEFRVAPPRLEPRRAARSITSVPGDEAETIADPYLRRIYLASRKKAMG